MISQCKINVNALPTKAYLEATIVPTVMKALTEVCEARPDNPLEFVAYYILKHNPNRKTPGEGAPATEQTKQ
ncbi:Dpy-30, conserved site domain protein [mine drainage metagenome]|uniref:Dpy-30, conserved site domain protein n=1 Tax=mine drainage metagenome TaxID=410659 RepID=T0ZD28_9ZZZZ